MRVIRGLQQGSPAWLAWRLGGVGGSDAATVLGVAPFEDATVENLFREKVDGWVRPTNFAMRRGTRLEPTARTLYEIAHRCKATPVRVEHDDAPWCRVSLDGLCRDDHEEAADPWVLELKCPNWQSHSWALAGEVPDYYRPQCQWQLFATGLDRLDYVSFSTAERFATNDRLAVVRVEPDAELQATLIEACGKFWDEVVRRRAAKAEQSFEEGKQQGV